MTKPKTRTVKKRDPETGDVITVEVPIEEAPDKKRRDPVTGEVLQPGQAAEPSAAGWQPWTPPTVPPPLPPARIPASYKAIGVIGLLLVGSVFAYPTVQDMLVWRGVDCADEAAVTAYQQARPLGRYRAQATECLTQITVAKAAAAKAEAERIAAEKAAKAERIAAAKAKAKAALDKVIVALTPKCNTPTIRGEAACWLKAQSPPNCYVWISDAESNETVTWSGACQNAQPHGQGELVRSWNWTYYGEEKTDKFKGSYRHGKRYGRWEFRYSSGTVATGDYVDGKRHGRWEWRHQNGSVIYNNYIHGKEQE